MWWDRSEPLEIHLSDRAVGFGPSSVQPGQWVETSGLDDSLRQVAARLSLNASLDVCRIRVWLGTGLAQPYLVPSASGVRNKHEARALAVTMASDATAIEGDVRIWIDRWRAGEATLAVAMPAHVWQGLQDVVTSQAAARDRAPRMSKVRRVAIVSIRPWWNLPFDELLADSRRDARRTGWSLSDGANTLHGVIDRGAVLEIGCDRPGPHDPTGDLLRRRLQVTWGAATQARHLFFERQASGTEARALPLGAWCQAAGDVA